MLVQRASGDKQPLADDGVEDDLDEYGAEEKEEELGRLKDDVVVQTVVVWDDHEAELDGEVWRRTCDGIVNDRGKAEDEGGVPEAPDGRHDPAATAVQVGLDRVHDGDVPATINIAYCDGCCL